MKSAESDNNNVSDPATPGQGRFQINSVKARRSSNVRFAQEDIVSRDKSVLTFIDI